MSQTQHVNPFCDPPLRRPLLALLLCVAVIGACDSTGRKPAPAREHAIPAVDPVQAASGLVKSTLVAAKDGALGGYPFYADHRDGIVVFSAEGDLWQVAEKGGVARRLTVHPGTERLAHFSPDGTWLAFSGEYDGNEDVYVMPAAGGQPRRLTYHPSPDQVIGWTPDGASILFRSTRDNPHGEWTMHTISRDGGMPTKLPLFRAARLSYEPHGKRVALNTLSLDKRRWKRYAGGRAVQIFVGTLDGGPLRKLTTFRGTNAFPMWYGNRIYFQSDRTGVQNIWSMTEDGRDLHQHTRFDDFDVRYPSLGQHKIVFQHRAELYLLDLKTDKVAPVPITLLSDAFRARTRFVDPSRYLGNVAIDPRGRYLGLEVRGDLHLIPAQKEGSRLALTQSSASREQGISFSPDGKELGTISDRTGECELFAISTSNTAPPRQLTQRSTAFLFGPNWSPDGRYIAYGDSERHLYIISARGGEPTLVDEAERGLIEDFDFSPDGRWLAYNKVEANGNSAIYLWHTERRVAHRVSSPYYNDYGQCFSSDGKYLAFISSRTINPYLGWFDLETIIQRADKPYLMLLSKDTRSPFLPKAPGEADDDKDKDKEADRDKAGDKGEPSNAAGSGESSAVPPLKEIKVDLDGLADRVVEVPGEPDNYRSLYAGKGFLLYLENPTQGMAEWSHFGSDERRVARLVRFDIKKKKAETFMDQVTGFAVSRDGKRIVITTKDKRLLAFDLDAKAPGKEGLAEATVPLAKIAQSVDPKAEWRQIFMESWRMMRDFYWTKDMAGVDWLAARAKYEPLLNRVTTRAELEDVVGEMVGELSLGHTYVWGGDLEEVNHTPVGLLGADFVPHPSGHMQVAKIYRGANWDDDRRSPLSEPHVGVAEGDFILELDGQPLSSSENIYARLQKSSGELVTLKVSKSESDPEGRKVVVRTLESEAELRYYDWVAKNRDHVREQTKDRVGYLHIPDMMSRGMIEFDRWFYPQVRKEGLIIDARWNRGGFVSEIIVKRLMRKVLAWQFTRTGWYGPYPSNTVHGKIVVLTNEGAGSDGDIFCRAVQVAKIGTLIGTRTWGGVVGINLSYPLVDSGVSTRPHYFAWWDKERGFDIEGDGVTPDIEVDADPAAMERGKDAQLDRGIQEILAQLKREHPTVPDFTKRRPKKSKAEWIKRYGNTKTP